MSAKPTPGPWVANIRKLPGRVSTIDISAGFEFPPVISWQGFDESDIQNEVHEANARLIAAAPRGLSASEFVYIRLLMLAHDSTRLALQPAFCALRDYIAEATGRSQRDVQEDYEARAVAASAKAGR